MDMAAAISATTSSRSRISRGRRRWRRRISLVSLLVIALIGAAATLRLAIVVAATPLSLWLVEVPRLIDWRFAEDTALASRARAAATRVSDPVEFTSQIGACARPTDQADTTCSQLVDNALTSDPSSGELWLFKAWEQLRSGDLGASTWDALRNSYRFAPREAWLAADRVVVGLRVFPLLPDDLRNDVVSDLHLLLGSWSSQSAPLVQAYAADERLRDTATDALHSLSADEIQRFVSEVKRHIRG